jgi:hypothetical protein
MLIIVTLSTDTISVRSGASLSSSTIITAGLVIRNNNIRSDTSARMSGVEPKFAHRTMCVGNLIKILQSIRINQDGYALPILP